MNARHILITGEDPHAEALTPAALEEHRVLEAFDGTSVREIWKQNRDGTCLLFTDLVMPGGISGKELGGRPLKENPQIKSV